MKNPSVETLNQFFPNRRPNAQTLRDDKKNAALIGKNWKGLKSRLAEAEKRFIAPSEIPSLLEQLSVMARDSGVRLISLKPVAAEDTGYYSRVPIRIQALEIGRAHV